MTSDKTQYADEITIWSE